MKRLLALLLAIIMVAALASCGEKKSAKKDDDDEKDAEAIEVIEEKEDAKISYDIPEGKQIPDDAVLDVTIPSHASWPYNEDWKVWQYIKENVGGTINVTAIPASDFSTKFPLMMATPEELPDLIGFQGKPTGFADYCAQGAFVALDDWSEFLPDYNAFWDGLPAEDQWMRNIRKSADGKVYYSPVYGMERSTNVRSWLYRKDIFEANGLEVPETTQELYEVSRKLKEIYPDSYPLCMRSGLSNFNVIGASWKPNFHYNVYYDFDAQKWSYGATEPVMREMVEYFKKMVDEGLIPQDFFTINTTTWQELVTTNKGFIMPEYQVRIDFFNNLARPANPEFTMAAMKPPYAENGTGKALVNKFNNDPSGYAVPNTNDSDSIANAMRYLNWLYSDEGAQTVSWGKEGETYKANADGKREFIVSYEGVQTLYGFKTIGTYTRIDPDAIDATVSAEQAATTDFIIENTYPELDPTVYLEFSSEDAKLKAEYEASLRTVVEEGIVKFVLGQRPMSEWDAFQAELAEQPIDEILAIYERAYNRVK